MKKALTIIFAVILASITMHDMSGAGSISTIAVTTKVLPVVRYEIIHQEEKLIITEEDMRNGYVDVPGAVIFSVRTNSTNGYLLTFFVDGNLLKEVTVYYDSLSHKVLETDNEVHMPFEGRRNVTKELSFRFYVSDVSPGVYDWPVAIMVSAM